MSKRNGGQAALNSRFSQALLLVSFSTKVCRRHVTRGVQQVGRVKKRLLGRSLVEATPCVPRRSPWQHFSTPRQNCHDFTLARSGAFQQSVAIIVRQQKFDRDHADPAGSRPIQVCAVCPPGWKIRKKLRTLQRRRQQ